MLTIAGYDITELIYAGTRSLIYRGIRQVDGRPVVLKTLAATYPTLGAIANLKHEYEVLSGLNIPDIIKPIEWKSPTASPVLVLEDFQGLSLREWIQQQRELSLSAFLPVALKLARVLDQLHQAQLIHRDIKPSNILIDPVTEGIKLIDFGLASKLTQTAQVLNNQPNHRTVAGTYAYMSPEQTGRMNRTVDYRTDLYSLGITFYEMLTGQLPFQATDPMAWVHSHIAKAPTPLQDITPEIPETIAQIVAKLLAKTAEDRYQQAQGLYVDLQICFDQLNTLGAIAPFAIGARDRSGQFQLPQILYGRASEILTLMSTFDRISQGAVELTLVSGYSGIGKSALVHEIHKPVVRQRGYFIAGKFDQLRRNVPYESVIQAFQDLVRQLLSESEIELAQWQQQLQVSLGKNGQVLTEVIPELELIMGPQPTVPDVTPAEAQVRFNQTFQKLVRVFARPEHPLVVFLDDLQWVDSASLDLITQLLTDAENGHFLLLGAYRDHEVGAEHPLMLTLDQLRKRQVTINEIALQPLQLTHVQQLVADALSTDLETIQEMGSLLFSKTHGNAFFTRMLLTSLYSEGQLTFDFNQATWQWDSAQLQEISLTDNVVELMTSQIYHLPKATQQLLTLAACIGDQFDLGVLSIVSEHAPNAVAQTLWPALIEGLITPLGENYRIPMLLEPERLVSDVIEQIHYRFVHDRIQEAAYGLLPASQRAQTHWQIGHLRLQQRSDLDLDEAIFEIVNHLNRGKALAKETSEHYQLAELNRQAGDKAKGASAYEAAIEYFNTGLSLLPESAWQDRYDLTFLLHRDGSECEYLCGHFDRAEHLFEVTLDQAASVIDQATIHIIRLVLYDNQGKFVENLSVGGEALRSLGLHWPQSPDDTASILEAELEIYRQHLQACQIPQLVETPEMTDVTARACMQLLVNMTGPAYFTDPTLVTLVTLKMANLSMQYGNSQWASQGYVFWGAMLSAAFRDYETAYTFGQVALQLKDRYNNYNEAKVLNSYVGFISHWRRPFKAGIVLLRRAYRVGVETGDVFTGYIVTHLGLHLILMGTELGEIQTELARYLAYLRKTQNEVFARQVQIYLYICSALQTGTFSCEGDDLADFDEATCIHLFQTNQYIPGLVSLFVFKAMHAWLFGRYDRALSFSHQSEEIIAFVAGMPGEAEHTFYQALILAALYEAADEETQSTYWETLQTCAEKLRGWADNCEANYQHRYLLVLAEIDRLSGDITSAIERYDQAIASAQAHEFVQNEAIANELAAQFWLTRGKANIARGYMQSAYYGYQQWGAKAKAQALARRHPKLLTPAIPQKRITTQTTDNSTMQQSTTPSSSSSDTSSSLDLSTVIKASHAIASEIRLTGLLETLMQIVIENAGAQTGVLVLQQEDTWQVEATGTIDGAVTRPPSSSTPLDEVLPLSVMNYVVRTQDPVLIVNGPDSEAFRHDVYIVKHQPKSILCAPIVNQGQMMGFLYLENNLTTGAFTPERLEILDVLSTQIAISLTNARLYEEMQTLNEALEDANRTLEQRVANRTQELSQTLELLKATQAELVIENELLRSADQPSSVEYQVGGSLGTDAPTYVVRQADRQLYKALRRGQYCYIFNARQMGKSSLRVQMMKRMQTEGAACVAIDLSVIGNRQTTQEQWYAGFMYVLSSSLGLRKQLDIRAWWRDHRLLSPLQRLGEFVNQVILPHITEDIIVFIDEVDSVISLEFEADDFFIWLRTCFNQRADHPDYRRLTFVLLGVATPSQLIQDPQRTPFNIGQAIELNGFQLHEAHPLLQGFSDTVARPQSVLAQILAWTGGQPFLSQKICQLIRTADVPIPEGEEQERIDGLVRSHMIENWETKDDPEHLKTIRDRLLSNPTRAKAMLAIYQQLLSATQIPADDSPEQTELRLSGLVIKQGTHLDIANRVYENVFNQAWVVQTLHQLT
ncbi:MAG: AAA family ATPase [Cyanobacteria bacterium J06635_1]